MPELSLNQKMHNLEWLDTLLDEEKALLKMHKEAIRNSEEKIASLECSIRFIKKQLEKQ